MFGKRSPTEDEAARLSKSKAAGDRSKDDPLTSILFGKRDDEAAAQGRQEEEVVAEGASATTAGGGGDVMEAKPGKGKHKLNIFERVAVVLGVRSSSDDEDDVPT